MMQMFRSALLRNLFLAALFLAVALPGFTILVAYPAFMTQTTGFAEGA